MSRWQARAAASLLIALLVGSLTAGVANAAVATAPAREPDAAPAEPVPLVTTEPAGATSSPDIVLHLAAPTDSAGLVRISNDGATWVVMPWAATVPWSLTDPAGGGMPDDGPRQVLVEFGDGTMWPTSGSADIVLDRAAPDVHGITVEPESPTAWRAYVTLQTDEPALGGMRFSLDGEHWSAWVTGPQDLVDLRSALVGGDWSVGERQVWGQARDQAGNESPVVTDAFTLTNPGFQGDEGKVKVRFDFPREAVTGELFTIRPVYPAGYTLPSDAWCEWVLHWGDDESIMGTPNPTWGEIVFERPKSSGACTEWTFTLPYTISRQFHWTFQLVRKDPDQDWGYAKEGLYVSPNGTVQIFRAELGSTDPHITTSSPPIVYLLPESTTTQAGDAVTYRLHVAGGTTVPLTGMFWTYPLDCYLNPHWSQQGGTTYTYRPNCNGPWVTGWTGTYKGGYMRSQYDPIVDGRAPYVRAPSVAIRAATLGRHLPVTVSWAASDSGSGVYDYDLQVSRNGGAWTGISLPSRLTKSIPRTLEMTGTYRFRARARDRVGNWSSWVAGPTVRAQIIQDSWSMPTWSAGWTSVADAALSGGTARTTVESGATVSLTRSTRGIAVVGRRGPDRGFARISVDGTEVATIDLRADILGPRTVLYAKTWASSGTHTLTITNLATTGIPAIEVDAFLILR